MESRPMTSDDTATSDDMVPPGRKRDRSNFETPFKKRLDSRDREISNLEAQLDGITKSGRLERLNLKAQLDDLQAQLDGITKSRRLERRKLEEAEKKAVEAEKTAVEKTLEEERKLFAETSLDQIRQNTSQIQALQKHWMTLLGNRIAIGSSSGLQQLSMASTLCQASTSKHSERALDGMPEQLKLCSDERDKWKSKCKKLEDEAVVAQVQMKKLMIQFETYKAQSVKMITTQSEWSNLSEEVCRGWLEQLEQRNIELQHCKAESSKDHLVELKQQILNRNEEIQRLERMLNDHNMKRKAKAAECIVCMDEFGSEPDRQRAHWKDCNHANVCYKCTDTLWNSNKRKCPTCNILASTMPGRLPPTIYL